MDYVNADANTNVDDNREHSYGHGQYSGADPTATINLIGYDKTLTALSSRGA